MNDKYSSLLLHAVSPYYDDTNHVTIRQSKEELRVLYENLFAFLLMKRNLDGLDEGVRFVNEDILRTSLTS